MKEPCPPHEWYEPEDDPLKPWLGDRQWWLLCRKCGDSWP